MHSTTSHQEANKVDKIGNEEGMISGNLHNRLAKGGLALFHFAIVFLPFAE